MFSNQKKNKSSYFNLESKSFGKLVFIRELLKLDPLISCSMDSSFLNNFVSSVGISKRLSSSNAFSSKLI